MGFGVKKQRTYFKIKEGKICVTNADKTESIFDDFTGKLKSIVYSEKTVDFNGSKVDIKSYDVLFQDGEMEYMWSVKHNSSLFQNFINSICTLDDFSGDLFIRPYLKDKKGRIYMEYNGQRLDWKYQMDEMPAIEQVMIKGKPAKDKDGNAIWDMEERLAWLKERVTEVNAKLKNAVSHHEQEVEVEDNDEELDAIFGAAKAV